MIIIIIVVAFFPYSGIVRNNSFWDILVFRKIQKSLGGRVKIIVSGSAPISSRVMEFLRVAFGCNVSAINFDSATKMIISYSYDIIQR